MKLIITPRDDNPAYGRQRVDITDENGDKVPGGIHRIELDIRVDSILAMVYEHGGYHEQPILEVDEIVFRGKVEVLRTARPNPFTDQRIFENE